MGCCGWIHIFIKLEGESDIKVGIIPERFGVGKSSMGGCTCRLELLEEGIIGKMVKVGDMGPRNKMWG